MAKVVVIGGGIVGASITYNLAKRGVSPVVLLEKNSVGSGSTAACLGGFRHQFSSELSVRLSIESIRELEHFSEETGYDPMIKKDGYLFIASTHQGREQLSIMSQMQRSLGVNVQTLSHSELVPMLPFYNFDGIEEGNLCLQDGHASTSSVLQGYLSKARELGAVVYENTEVVGLTKDGEEVSSVVTRAGAIKSSKVVISAGVYSKRLGELAGENVPVDPYPRKILFTRGAPRDIPPTIPLIVDIDTTLALGREGNSIFFSDNTPTNPSYEPRFPEDYDEKLIRKAISRVSKIVDLPIGYAVTGLYEVTPDANPIISELKTRGLYCCAGFAGHGFMHSPAVGRLMSEIVLEEKPHIDVSPFSVQRFNGQTRRERLII